MPAQTVSDVNTSVIDVPALEILNDANTVLWSAPALERAEGEFGLNVEPFTTWGVEGQSVKGSGTVLIGEHTLFALALNDGTPWGEVRKDLLDALKAGTKVRVGTSVWPLAGALGFVEEADGVNRIFGVRVAPSQAENVAGTRVGL